jgi:hypothetical protein
MILRLEKFQGMAPKIAARLLPVNVAQAAHNCRFGSGALRPWPQPQFVSTPAKTGTKKSIFPYGSGESRKWFHWLEDVNCCRGPVAADGFDRVYWTGDGAPKYTVNSIATSGGTQYPTNSYTLGIPAPAAAPTVAAAGTATSTDPTLIESRSYVYTYVSAYGEEGPPSPPSDLVDVAPGQSVDLSGMSTAPSGAYNIATKNIYRTNTGSSGTEYQYVGSVAVATTTLSDTVDSAALGEVPPSAGWVAPNSGLKGLIAHPGGFLVGYYDNVLCCSEQYQPHAWPAAYQKILTDPIVACGAFGNSILVTTAGLPHLVTGGTPGGMDIERLERGEACISKRGLVDLGYAVAYPGPSGIWLAGTGQLDLITEGILSRDNWQALNPSTLLAARYERALIGFTSVGTFVLDVGSGNYSTLDLAATAAWYDEATGRLYLVVNGDIVEWCGGTSVYPLTWKSKPFQAASPITLGAAQAFATTYPLTLKLYADGMLKLTRTVADEKPFRLPGGFRATWWEVEVSGSVEITSILLASTMAELGQV